MSINSLNVDSFDSSFSSVKKTVCVCVCVCVWVCVCGCGWVCVGGCGCVCVCVQKTFSYSILHFNLLDSSGKYTYTIFNYKVVPENFHFSPSSPTFFHPLSTVHSLIYSTYTVCLILHSDCLAFTVYSFIYTVSTCISVSLLGFISLCSLFSVHSLIYTYSYITRTI